MAGQSEKKRAKSAEIHSFYYFWIILVVSFVFIPYRLIWRWSSVSKYHLVGVALMYTIYYITYASIVEAIQMGMKYE